MFNKLDNNGQSSAELILIIGGLLVIVLLVGSYISNIMSKSEKTFKTTIKKERDFIINKI